MSTLHDQAFGSDSRLDGPWCRCGGVWNVRLGNCVVEEARMQGVEARARAKATERWPENGFEFFDRRNAYVTGFLAGHEVASRPREVPTVDQIEQVLADHTWGGVNTMGRVTCHDSTGGSHVYEGTGVDHERHQAEAIAALYNPEEDR